MIYVALAQLLVLGGVIFYFQALLRAKDHAHSRREDQLLDKALHAAGRPWTPAPADYMREAPSRDELLEEMHAQNYALFTTSPEQEP